MLLNCVLEKTLESPLDCKEIQPILPKGNQPWIFIGRADAEAPVLWPPDAKSWLIGEDLDAGKYWRQKEKGTPENKMVEWHHQLSGHEFEQTPEDGEVHGSLACLVHGVSELDTTEWLNNNKKEENPLTRQHIGKRNPTVCPRAPGGWVKLWAAVKPQAVPAPFHN